MLRKIFFVFIVMALVTTFAFVSGGEELWKPTKPITIIVPWSAGGATDQIIRICAGELEEKLGQKIVVVNQPGASGSVGTKTVLDAPRDGYTWASGAIMNLGTYAIQGFLDTKIEDWHFYFAVANVDVVSVHPDTPYQTFGDLLQAFEDKPGEIAVATAGESSCGRVGMEDIKKFTGIDYKHMTYGGGNPAVIATVSGETEVVPQLASEQADMIRAKKLRPLAVLDNQPLELADYGTIPPVTKWIPEFIPIPFPFGIFVPKGVPEEVVTTLNQLWHEVIANSEVIKKYASDRGAVFYPYWGTDALVKAFPSIQFIDWLYYDMGVAEISPLTIGIPRP